MDQKSISKAVIRRLPRYYRYLGELMEEGVERISSNELSEKMRVTASQIRQDLNNFGGFGQQGYGYNVPYLYTEIGKILGLDKIHHMIIIGAGNLGQALANYVKFEKRGFKVVGIFDVNPVLKGISIRGNQIRMMDELPEFLKEQEVQIAALTLPKNNAAETADFLVQHGIKAIWNFAHLDLDVPEDVIVENVHLSESLMRLSYNLNCYVTEHQKKRSKSFLVQEKAAVKEILQQPFLRTEFVVKYKKFLCFNRKAGGRMEQIVSGSQMKALDKATIDEMGIPSLVLMERAALSVCDAMEKEGFLSGKILLLCGGGNNGADGVAAARILTLRGYKADVCILGNPEHFTQEMKKQIEIAEKYGISFVKTYQCSEYTTIVDSLLGVGLSRNLEGKYKKAVEDINKSGCRVAAVDIPSGICADTGKILGDAVKADLTVTFAYKKAGMCLYPGAAYTGKIITADIGIYRHTFPLSDTEVFACGQEDLRKIKRNPSGNKGSFGKIFLIAGSRDIFGAAYLSGLAAMRAGAGMLKICTRKENRQLFSCFPEAMLLTYDDETDLKAAVREGLAWADTAGMGPGVGTGLQAQILLKTLLEECTCPLVLDADAINILPKYKEKLKKCRAQVILTPHLGEFSRLTDIEISAWKEDPVRITREAAKEYRAIMVCKDARTIVSDGTCCWINLSGNDGMATAGSGDVLTGTILGLLAQKIMPREAAVLGVCLHGCAGDRTAKVKGRAGMLAGDMIQGISEILCSLEGKEGKS